jgi:hypothetical protein
MVYGAVVTGVPRLAPSRVNCTLLTPTLSVALAVTDTPPVRVAPVEGAVIDTVGGWVSMTVVPPTYADIGELAYAAPDDQDAGNTVRLD